MPLSLSCLFFLAAVEQKEPEVLAIPIIYRVQTEKEPNYEEWFLRS